MSCTGTGMVMEGMTGTVPCMRKSRKPWHVRLLNRSILHSGATGTVVTGWWHSRTVAYNWGRSQNSRRIPVYTSRSPVFLSKLFYSLIVILMAFIGITFPYMNNQQVALRYFGFAGEINLSMLLLAVLTAGVIIGFLVNFRVLIKGRSKLSQSRRKARNPAPNS